MESLIRELTIIEIIFIIWFLSGLVIAIGTWIILWERKDGKYRIYWNGWVDFLSLIVLVGLMSYGWLLLNIYWNYENRRYNNQFKKFIKPNKKDIIQQQTFSSKSHQQLFEILTLVTAVRINKWETVSKIVDAINEKSVIIKSKKWDDTWKEMHIEHYPLDLSKLDTWSTYNNCIELRFSNDTTIKKYERTNQLICDVQIYDGNMNNGYRKRLRFKAQLLMQPSFIHQIEESIEIAFEDYLGRAYIKHLESEKQLWINKMKSAIIGIK